MAVRKYVLSKVAGGVRAFFSLKAGAAHEGATPGQGEGHQSGQAQDQERRATQEREIERTHRLLAAKDRELAELRAMLDRSRGESTVGAVNPENVIWIFGAGSTGSTWLSSMMAEIEEHALWSEPWVGALFGRYYYHVDERKHQAPGFILGPYKESWLGSITNFVMVGARIRFADL